MTIFYVIFILYTVAIIWGPVRIENHRYRLVFGYIFGIVVGAVFLAYVGLDTAIIISILTGLAMNARMMWTPNR